MFQKMNVRDEQAHPLFTYHASSLSLEGFDKCIRLPKYLFLMIRFGQNKMNFLLSCTKTAFPKARYWRGALFSFFDVMILTMA
ncbi:hypothetical protein MKN04_07275 [Paenibacillus polymyxa]|nr:hypothetical protein EL23_08225 [Paenibacillus polymyxa]MCH6187460.1 hypothetical protein [Paenibacillus polymyxa]